jgi:thioredoxin reductase (NADPH)
MARVSGEEQHDVVIIGAGTAGVSCALECFDVQLDTVVFEADNRPGGQLAEIPNSVRNLAVGTFPNGSAVRDSLEAAAAILQDRLRISDPVTRVDVGGRWIESGATRVHAKALVIATGTAHQQLAAAPDGAFGGDVTYLLDDDRLQRFAGRDVVVIGGGDSGTLDALELANSGSKVWLVHRSDILTARHNIIEQVRRDNNVEQLAGWQLESVHGSDHLEGVTLVRLADDSHRHLDANGLVVKIARVPRTELFRGQLELDRTGAIVVDEDLRTSSEGVFAAGDVVTGAYARVAAALGQGSLAARSVLHYLQDQP